jgi:hypothetical protein
VQWPWTSRALLDAANDRALKAEAQCILLETRVAFQSDNHAQSQRILQNQLDAEKSDNKLLLDRIVQLAGQPPIFHPLPAPTLVPAEPKVVSTMPGPETRVSFADVHRAARKDIADGKIGMFPTEIK